MASSGLSPVMILIALLLVGSMGSALADPDSPVNPRLGELMEADRAFAARTAEQGAAGWASFFHADGVMFPPQGRIDGREAIEAYMAPGMGPGQPLLRWEPTEAVLAESGEIGWTVGRWELVSDPGGSDELILSTGNYLSVWRRDADGRWKVAADIGNTEAETPSPPPASVDWKNKRGPERFPEIDWLVGEWQGHGVFSNGNKTWLHRSYSYDVGGVFLQEHTQATFPPDSLSTEFEIHQDKAMWFRESETGDLKSTTFFVEGYVTTATVRVEDGGRRYIVESKHIENGPPGLATRFTVQRSSEDELEESFEMKLGGGEWSKVEHITLRRIHAGGSR